MRDRIIEFWCPLNRGTTLEDCADFGCEQMDVCIHLLQRKSKYIDLIISDGKLPKWVRAWLNKLKDLS